MSEPDADPERAAEQENDPRWREEAMREHNELFEREERPVLEALAAAGLEMAELSDLINGPDVEDPEQIAVLLEWLPRVEYPAVRETIARALTVRAARPVAAPVLLRELTRSDEEQAGWMAGASAPLLRLTRTDQGRARFSLANALAYTADRSFFGEIAALLSEDSLGDARSVLVGYFGRWRGEPSIAVLRPLLADDDLGIYALAPLAKLRAVEAKPEMERFLTHEQDWVRNEARRALAKVDRGSR